MRELVKTDDKIDGIHVDVNSENSLVNDSECNDGNNIKTDTKKLKIVEYDNN